MKYTKLNKGKNYYSTSEIYQVLGHPTLFQGIPISSSTKFSPLKGSTEDSKCHMLIKCYESIFRAGKMTQQARVLAAPA